LPVTRPYRRTSRQFVDGQYRREYVLHPKFALSQPRDYIRAFLLIQKDLQELFDYIEPADENLRCYSYRIHELLLRVCVEVEANCRAILTENGYNRQGRWHMGDYGKIEHTHFASAYEIWVPNWRGAHGTRSPFSAWAGGRSPDWYQAYNATKHDRHASFEEANFGNLIDACCGLLVILSAQFGTEDFVPGGSLLLESTDTGIGDYFGIKFPTNVPATHRYDFNWKNMSQQGDPFHHRLHERTVTSTINCRRLTYP